MKFSYEKLLLGLSGLALSISVSFFAFKFNRKPDSFDTVGQKVFQQYEPISAPLIDSSTPTWPNPVAQAPGELYDVFTPPAIWIDENGTFIFESPISEEPPVPFGVYLATLEKEPYRIQLEGYVEEDFNDPKKSVLLLFDEEKQKRVRARVGQSLREHEFSVFNFTIDRISNSNGIKKLAVATILDFRDGRRIFLTHGTRKYEEVATVTLRSYEDPNLEIKITNELPYGFETPKAKYLLEKINLEESSVTIKKLANDDLESLTKKLFTKPKSKFNKNLDKQLESKSDGDEDNQTFDFDF